MNYYMVIDTETANGLEDPLFYDLGIAIVDIDGKAVYTESLVIYEIFVKERELMQSAYYADKLPKYQEDINNKKRKLVKFSTAQKIINNLAKRFKVKAIIAHNMRFDYNATNTTLRYLTKSKERFFLPYGIPIWCTLTMSRQTLGKLDDYKEFSKELYGNNKVSMKAEDIYRYLINDKDFVEDHTGLEDALIEAKIFAKCMEMDRTIQKSHYKGGDKPKRWVKNTEIQKRINRMAKLQVGY